jgi:hypothetical protein
MNFGSASQPKYLVEQSVQRWLQSMVAMVAKNLGDTIIGEAALSHPARTPLAIGMTID